MQQGLELPIIMILSKQNNQSNCPFSIPSAAQNAFLRAILLMSSKRALLLADIRAVEAISKQLQRKSNLPTTVATNSRPRPHAALLTWRHTAFLRRVQETSYQTQRKPDFSFWINLECRRRRPIGILRCDTNWMRIHQTWATHQLQCFIAEMDQRHESETAAAGLRRGVR